MRKAKAVFVTGTDTGAGKTVISGLLARYLSEKGYRVITQKWIQTGSKTFPGDVNIHLRLMKKKRKEIADYMPYVTPYTFKFPSSPHLAARLEKKEISAARIKKTFKRLSKRFDFIIVEGIGGILVPFSKRRLVIDIAKELNLPILIASKNRLGAINHTLLTIEAARKRRMRILGIIFNNQRKSGNEIISKDNPRIIEELTGEKILGDLPWLKNRDLLYKEFLPIGKRVYQAIGKSGY